MLAAIFALAIASVLSPAAPTWASQQILAGKIIYSFPSGELDYVDGVIGGPSGVLYGVTSTGGVNGPGCFRGCGYIFSLTPSKSGYVEQTIYSFLGGSAGRGGGLHIGPDGTLYVSSDGGPGVGCAPYGRFGCGTIFTLTRSGGGYAKKVVYNFSGVDGGGVAFIDSAGVIYGEDEGNGYGGFFTLTPAAGSYVYSVVYNFSKFESQRPSGPIAGGNGTLYGISQGTNEAGDLGTVFALNPTTPGAPYAKTILHTFSGLDGFSPYALVVDPNGNLVGSTQFGGNFYERGEQSRGVLFELQASAHGFAFHVLHAFTKNEGDNPQSQLVADRNGVLYGSTTGGTLFSLKPAGMSYTYNVIYNFANLQTTGPAGGMVVTPSGDRIFGSVLYGGQFSDGAIWEVTRKR